MPAPDDSDFSAEEFAEKLEAGDFDGRVHEELKKLSHDQLLEVANISMRLRKAKADEASLNRKPPKNLVSQRIALFRINSRSLYGRVQLLSH